MSDFGDFNAMNVNVTREVASAHRNLEKLCEQFEASVDEFCASPPQIRPHEFYDCECIPIAAACAKAHAEFPDVYSYEVETYEKEIARSERALNQQTSELKKNKTQITTAHEHDVAEAEKVFQRHQLRLEETAVKSIETVQSKVAELSQLASKVGVKISDFTERDPKELLENKNVGSDSKISFRKALREAKRQDPFRDAISVWMFIIGAIILLLAIKLFHLEADAVFSGIIPPVAASITSAVIAITFFVISITGYTKKKARAVMTLKELVSAAEGECVIIQNEMQNEVDKADAVRQQEVKEADSKRTNDNIQDTEIAAKALAAHEKNVENASLRRDQAIAYIEQEYQTFDKRLCQSLEKFQSAINAWSTEHASVTAMLDKNSVQSSNENSEHIASHFTRVGTISIWDIPNVVSEIRVEKTKRVAPDTTIESVKSKPIEEEELGLIDRYRRDAENGDAEAQYELGLSYIYGVGVEENISEGVKWFQKAAEQGKTEAQFNLAIAYANGRGIQQNSVEAAKWFQKAADQEDAASQYFLGTMYSHGDGVRQDYEEAIKWYLKAAEQEYPDAMCNLGGMYTNGEGVQQDYGEAIRWFQKAAELEHAQSQFNLGLMYEEGTGIRKDEVEAVQWYKKSADQDFHLAQYNLGIMYINGTGVKQDYIVASKWIQKAADQDMAEALYLLGVMYENGEGVEKNNMKATNLYRRAAKQGNEEAIEALRDIDKG